MLTNEYFFKHSSFLMYIHIWLLKFWKKILHTIFLCKNIIFSTVLFAFLLLPITWHANIFTSKKVDGVTLKYVSYDIHSNAYTLQVALSSSAKSLDALLLENNAITGINGVFFCPADYARCKGKDYTINERFQNGKDLSYYTDTGERGVFWWTKDKKPFIFKTHDIETIPRDKIHSWLWNYPILLTRGINTLPYYEKKWLIDKKMTAALPRHFICSNVEKDTIIFWRTSAVPLSSLPNVLSKIGCSDALNLDAGNSSQLIYNGKYLIRWKRNIIDAFILSHKDIDTQQIHSRIRVFEHSLKKKLENTDMISTFLFLSAYQKYFQKQREKIYQQNRSDIHNEDGVYVWYEINIQKTEILKQVFMLNLLERKIQELKHQYIHL